MQLKFKGSARKEILQARKFYKPFHRKESVKLVCEGIVLKCVIWPPKLVSIICLLYIYIYFIYTYYRSTHYIYIYKYYICLYISTHANFYFEHYCLQRYLHFQGWYNPLYAVFVKLHDVFQLSVPAELYHFTSFQDKFRCSRRSRELRFKVIS